MPTRPRSDSVLTESLARLRVLASLALVGLPVYLIQGRRLRRRTPRLPEAPEPREGQIEGGEPPLRLMAIGESPLAGVGVDSADETVIAHLSAELASATGRLTRWSIVARGGVSVAETIEQLLPQVPEHKLDVVLIGLGVNDCLQLTPTRRWQARLNALIDTLHDRCRPELIVLAGVPPMQHFPALPRPLADMLGLRARLLDVAAAELASSRTQVIHVPMAFDGRSSELFCHDGFHPSAQGHRMWARQLATAVRPRFTSS